MPTKDEFLELIENTADSWTIVSGVKGGEYVSGTDPSKRIFFSAAGIYAYEGLSGGLGEYWSSTVVDTRDAWVLCVDSLYARVSYSYQRRWAQSVRGCLDIP